MQDSILSKLEASRKELLDLGMRNPLLNYRLTAGKGIHIVDERSSYIYDILVKQEKAMTFLGRKAPEDGKEIEEVIPTEEELEQAYSDSKLQTNDLEESLQKRLLNTFYAANTSIEEQGVNILYLALGMLEWYEDDKSVELRSAPLLLVPVNLERSSARERFRLKYSLEEIGANISLQAKMKSEYEIMVPNLSEPEDFNITEYFAAVKAAVQKEKRWQVQEDIIELGFFSFAKFMIYNDLDESKWTVSKRPTQHPILQALLGSGFKESGSLLDEDAFLDSESNAHELYQVVDADSSQLHAMLAVKAGRHLVIQGPPGTGKSQTITNIIADAIGQGKKVLFVAEKMAALEVVKRRLDSVYLGDACLELHSHKAKKKNLYGELIRTLELGKPTSQYLQAQVALLEKHKSDLNQYCVEINSVVGKSGMTMQQVMGRLLEVEELIGGQSPPKIFPGDLETWDAQRMLIAESIGERLQATLFKIGVPSDLLFYGTALKILHRPQQEELNALLGKCKMIVDQLRSTSENIAGAFDSAAPIDSVEFKQLTEICRHLSVRPELKGIDISNASWVLNCEDIAQMIRSGERANELRTIYAPIFIDEAWGHDFVDIRRRLIAHSKKWYRFLIKEYKNAVAELTGYCQSELPKSHATRLQYLDHLLEYKRESKTIDENDEFGKTLFTYQWKKVKSNWKNFKNILDYLCSVHRRVGEGSFPKGVLTYLKSKDNIETDKINLELLIDYESQLSGTQKELLTKLALHEKLRKKPLADELFYNQSILYTNWQSRLAEIHLCIEWNNVVESANDAHLTFLTEVSVDWTSAAQQLILLLKKTWYEYLLETGTNRYSAIRKFERANHEELVHQFKIADKRMLQYNQVMSATAHWQGLPKMDGGGQINILKGEFHKKSRLKPIRKVIEEAGLAIQRIKPVFMMSPLSIANFLPPGSVEFDLVIFDEASQVRPVDAIGALLRGKQLVVVGDAKQLPPTSFFDSMNSDLHDEDNVTADIQSILGMCAAQGVLGRMLRWHYRSRHESLISVSNNEFYENKLIIFPSPGSKNKLGLVFRYQSDTVYERGKTRTNPKEAEYVAEAVIEHARKYPKLSLGVVAFSTTQRQAIQDALELRRRRSPDVEAFFSSHLNEPFFVKNLENVQGDERDVIFISVGYGKTGDGPPPMNFGPLNNTGGEKRLNVLITRAKLRCEVYTNLTSDDIDLSKTQSVGVKSLKNFLYYAQYGRLNNVGESIFSKESFFEDIVLSRLKAKGYKVTKQLGTKAFYLDMAVADQDNPGRFILGIECDGESYQSARCARDRDRLRHQVLEGIGWKTHRIWSTDWFRNPDREFSRLEERIIKVKKAVEIEDESNDEKEENPDQFLLREKQLPVEISPTILYQKAQLSTSIAYQEIHLHSIAQLANWVVDVVLVESPVHVDEVARRIVEAGNVNRVGPRIKEQINLAITAARRSGRIVNKGDFLWLTEMMTPVIRDRSQLHGSARKIEYICKEEITLAIELVVKNALAIRTALAVPYVTKMFGFGRATEEMRDYLTKNIDDAVKMNIISRDGEMLRPAEKSTTTA